MGRCEKELFRVVERELAGPREKYAMYMNEPNLLYEALEKVLSGRGLLRR